MADAVLLRAFRFEVKLLRSPVAEAGGAGRPPNQRPSGQQLGDGAFQECSGLEVEMDVQEYPEGGRNDGVIRRLGRAKYPNLVLRRGMFMAGDEPSANRQLWEWLQGVLAGERPAARYDGIVEVWGAKEEIVASWVFDRGLPVKVSGPQLNGRTGEIAIEELQIAHEGLRLVSPT
jgi:phage tail-like protein